MIKIIDVCVHFVRDVEEMMISIVCNLFAGEDDDFEHINTVVTFEKEEMEIRKRVRILDNQVLEPNKTFSAVIEALPGRFPVSVMSSTATVEIEDDDCEWFKGFCTLCSQLIVIIKVFLAHLVTLLHHCFFQQHHQVAKIFWK